VESQIEEASSHGYYKKLSKQVDDRNNILLISTINEKIIGMAHGKIMNDGTGWLGFLGVLQDHRRMGVGRALANRFIKECKDKGTQKISLDTHPLLIPAIKLYESMGFIKEGFIKNPHGLKLILYSKKMT
jgi:ribosomal protein S18 acetylase RimI-like enzyme